MTPQINQAERARALADADAKIDAAARRALRTQAQLLRTRAMYENARRRLAGKRVAK